MENKKLYVLIEYSGDNEDYQETAIEIFSSEELCDKIRNGLNDTADYLLLNRPINKHEQYIVDEKVGDISKEECNRLVRANYDKIDEYWLKYNIDPNRIPYYFTQEVDFNDYDY